MKKIKPNPSDLEIWLNPRCRSPAKRLVKASLYALSPLDPQSGGPPKRSGRLLWKFGGIPDEQVGERGKSRLCGRILNLPAAGCPWPDWRAAPFRRRRKDWRWISCRSPSRRPLRWNLWRVWGFAAGWAWMCPIAWPCSISISVGSVVPPVAVTQAVSGRAADAKRAPSAFRSSWPLLERRQALKVHGATALGAFVREKRFRGLRPRKTGLAETAAMLPGTAIPARRSRKAAGSGR